MIFPIDSTTMDITTIEKELNESRLTLVELQQKFGSVARAAALSRYAYEQARSRAMLEHNLPNADTGKLPTVDVLKAIVTMAVAEQQEAARMAEAELDILTRNIDIAKTIQSNVQSAIKLMEIEARV